jgi:peptide/nickel transport system permease protein
MSVVDTGIQVVNDHTESFYAQAWLLFRKNKAGMISLTFLLIIVLLVLLAPFIAPYDPTEMDFENILSAPNRQHIMGTDDFGRDIFSRILWGGRDTLRIALFAEILIDVSCVTIGLVIGYFSGKVDLFFMRIIDILMAFPSILFMLTIVAILGPGLSTIFIAIAVSSIPKGVRFSRALVLELKAREYVAAAKSMGASPWFVMMEHLVPNMLPTIIVFSTLGFGASIMVTAGLSYLGLGPQPPSPEWGALLNYGRKYLGQAWWMSFFPGLVVSSVIFSINILGNALRDVLDPKLKH